MPGPCSSSSQAFTLHSLRGPHPSSSPARSRAHTPGHTLQPLPWCPSGRTRNQAHHPSARRSSTHPRPHSNPCPGAPPENQEPGSPSEHADPLVYRPSQTPHLPLSPGGSRPAGRALDTKREPLGARLPASPGGSGGLPDIAQTPGAFFVGGPALAAARLGRTEDSPPGRQSRREQGPVPPSGGEAQRALSPRPQEAARCGQGQSCGRGRQPPPTCLSKPTQSGRGAPPRRKCAGEGQPAPGKVLIDYRSCGICIDGVYHPLWAAFPNNPTRRPDPARRGRYRPHTVHGLSLDQKDSGPGDTGQAVFRRHISPARPSDGIRRWALPSSLAATEGILSRSVGSWLPAPGAGEAHGAGPGYPARRRRRAAGQGGGSPPLGPNPEAERAPAGQGPPPGDQPRVQRSARRPEVHGGSAPDSCGPGGEASGGGGKPAGRRRRGGQARARARACVGSTGIPEVCT
ncbi:hypothetical protein Q5P01_000182 [Channa striata]|uniref:Uncharacterized protein n=1 Tax=Channa striata TaxID=64152 RepID=A0AA88ILC2_CHASR|nr:hypothetical protein Q5P01_000182 [Channa striata]